MGLELRLRFCRSVDKVCILHRLLVAGVVAFFFSSNSCAFVLCLQVAVRNVYCVLVKVWLFDEGQKVRNARSKFSSRSMDSLPKDPRLTVAAVSSASM